MPRYVGLAVFAASLWITVPDLDAQSLAELAARAAARRAEIATPSRVYTNEAPTDRVKIITPATATPVVLPLRSLAIELPMRSLASTVPPQSLVVTNGAAVMIAPSGLAAPAAVPVPLVAPPLAALGGAVSLVVENAPTSSLAGWSSFQIKKSQAEMMETTRLAEGPQLVTRTGPDDVRLPPQRDVLRVSAGVGYLQGADFGGDLAASGKINGMQTDASAFVTAGSMGLQTRNARVSIFSPGGMWRAEGGDLFSDLRGLARGARVSRSVGQSWTPSVSVYMPPRLSASRAPVFAYRDRLQVLPRARVGGEVTSDGAAFLQGQYGHPKLDVTAFYRVTRSPTTGRDKGVSAAMSLGRGVAVSGAIRLSDAVGDSSQWQLASVRLPLPRQASITLERSWWSGLTDDGSTNAVTLQVALGPVRLIQRLQWGRTDYWQRVVPYGFDRRMSQSSASYTPGPWGSVNYQQSTQWSDDGRMQQWDEIASVFQLGTRTSLHVVTAFPDLWDPQRLRIRVKRQLSPTLQLEGQYGRLSAFQMTRGSDSEESRVMVTIRKTWRVESPARGGDVHGRAIDQLGAVVPGALVRLGPYSTITDATGAYSFTRVPNGEFELALDRNKLPAAYAWDEKPRALSVTGRSQAVDLEVIPLNSIRGRVFLDRNGNGLYDDDEGIVNTVVAVGDAVTATSGTGSYAFYNLPPGRYTIKLDVSRLPRGLSPASPAALNVDLTGQGPLVGLNFMLQKKDMPILMQRIPQ